MTPNQKPEKFAQSVVIITDPTTGKITKTIVKRATGSVTTHTGPCVVV